MASLPMLRNKKGLTQQQIAAALGIDRSTYSRIESGQRVPHVDVAIRIARILDTNVEDLFMPPNVHMVHTNASDKNKEV